jgi:hypothetical protein
MRLLVLLKFPSSEFVEENTIVDVEKEKRKKMYPTLANFGIVQFSIGGLPCLFAEHGEMLHKLLSFRLN